MPPLQRRGELRCSGINLRARTSELQIHSNSIFTMIRPSPFSNRAGLPSPRISSPAKPVPPPPRGAASSSDWPVSASRGDHLNVSFGSDALRRTSMMPPAKVTKLTEKERLDANVLRQLLEHYFRIVRATVLDSVPKAIMLMMINLIQDKIQERLMQSIYLAEDDDAFSGLTRESEEVRRRRDDVKEQVACLRKAISVMREL
mmetsp:Transcript_16668/g.45377  ORF Transcript_16668/g.45377 Transcript_16668/m.45377 type:complete len:202 (+) Transcript_16668:2462-3067(+)